MMTGNKLHDGAERGPLDRDGARCMKPKSEPRQVCLAVQAFPLASIISP